MEKYEEEKVRVGCRLCEPKLSLTDKASAKSVAKAQARRRFLLHFIAE
jgi:hypothetical protein